MLRPFLKELVLLAVLLIIVILEFVTKSVLLPDFLIKSVNWFVILTPILLAGFYAKSFISKFKESGIEVFKLKNYLLPSVAFLYVLFIAYLRVYESYAYLSGIQNKILSYGNTHQFIAFISLLKGLYFTKFQKWEWAFKVFTAIFGKYQIPTWIKWPVIGFGKGLKWCFNNKQQTAIASGVYALIFGFVHYFPTIEMKNTVIVRDSVQDSELGKKKIQSITVNFSSPYSPDFMVRDGKFTEKIYPLNISFDSTPFKLDKKDIDLNKHITVSPFIKGKWTKTSDTRIRFMPENHWQTGIEYKVSISANLHRDTAKLDEYDYSFKLNRFSGTISQLKFYVNPKNPSEKKLVGHLSFNYPVDKSSVENHAVFYLKDNEGKVLKQLSGQVLEDKNKTRLYIHSDSFKLNDKEMTGKLEILKGISSSMDSKIVKETVSETTKSINIPSVYSFMNFNIERIKILKDKEDVPYHSFKVTSNSEIDIEELKQKLEVYELPDRPSKELLEYVRRAVLNNNIYSCYDRYNDRMKWHTCDVEIDANLRALLVSTPFAVVDQKYVDNKNHTFKFEPEVGKTYFFRVVDGLESKEGFSLKNDFTVRYKAPSFPKELKLTNAGSVLTLRGEKKLSLYTRGISGVKVTVKQLMPNQLHHFLSMTNKRHVHNRFNNSYTFNAQNITEEFSFNMDLSYDLKKGGYSTIDLGPYLAKKNFGQKNYGIFYLDVQDKQSSRSIEQLIVVSDMAYVLKYGKKNQLYVMSIASGNPLANVNVELVKKNGKKSIVCKTDESGHCAFEYPRENLVGFILTKGEDLMFASLNDRSRKVNYSRFDTGGEYHYGGAGKAKAFVFSDRKLYRPGEDGHLGIVVKDSAWSGLYEGEIVQIKMTDPRGNLFKTKKLKVGTYGLMEYQFKLPYSAPTGVYGIEVTHIKSSGGTRSIGRSNIKVQEFLPDKMKIISKFNKRWDKAWVSPNDLEAIISLRNLYGTPAVGNKITSSMQLMPSRVTFPLYTSFTFYDDTVLKDSVFEELGDSNTDESGNIRIGLNLDKYKGNTFKLRLRSEGFMKAGGRSVVAENSIMISPNKFLLGIKKPSGLKFITKKTKVAVELVAINNDYDSVDVNGLKVFIYEKKYQNSLVKLADGTFEYQDVKEPILLTEEALNISKNGTKYFVNNSKVGEFIAKVKDSTGKVLNSFEYSIVGEADLTRSLYKNAELKVKLDKTDYLPGENIQLSVKAPYTGYGLITIEREKVFSHKWFRMDKETKVLNISVPRSLEGNAYVNISLLRGKKSQKIFTSPYSYAVVPFTIDKSKREQKLTLSAPVEAKPGSTIEIEYKTNRPGKIIVYGVDEGVLQLAKYTKPNPLKYFFKKRALQVETWQLFSIILPELDVVRKAFAAGGGAGAGPRKGLNPFKRKFKKAVAFWSGILEANTSFKKFKYKVPGDFNGTMKFFAVAVNNDSVDVTQRKFVSRDNVIITPNFPTFLAPGDVVTLSATIANNIPGDEGKSDNIKVSLTTSKNLEIVGEKSVNLKVKKLLDKVVKFKVKALKKPGNADFKFTANYNSEKSSYAETMSVRPAIPMIRRSWRQFIEKGEAYIQLNTNDYFSEYLDLDMALSTGYLALIQGNLKYLSKYPYGCSEQITSKAIPYAVFDSQFLNKTQTDVKNYLEETFGKLLERQDSRGRFSLYPGHAPNSDFLNLYITRMLIEAKKNGHSIPEELFDRSIRNLNNIINDGASTAAAQAIYLLAMSGVQVGKFARAMAGDNHKNDIVNLYLAGTFSLLKDVKNATLHAGKVSQKFENFNYSQGHYYRSFYSNASFNRVYLEIMGTHFPDLIADKEDELAMNIVNDINRYGANSLFSAQSILALKGLGQGSNIAESKVSLSLKGGEKIPLKGDDLKKIGQYKDRIEQIKIEVPKKAFLAMELSGFNTILKDFNKDLQITKKLIYPNGSNEIKVGDEVIVQVKVSADSRLTNNVIVDLLPGGFDLVWKNWDRNLNGEDYGDTKSADFIEKREDRVLIFTDVNKDVGTYYYKIKAVSPGKFTLPPIYVENMYNSKRQALTKAETIEVKE